jgi:hypothetical protein
MFFFSEMYSILYEHFVVTDLWQKFIGALAAVTEEVLGVRCQIEEAVKNGYG